MGKKKKKKVLAAVADEPLTVKIHAPLAYVSGMDALAYAQRFAQQREDASQMIEIANVWIELGNQLLTHGIELVYSEVDEEATLASSGNQTPFGFGGTPEDDDEEEPEPTPFSPED